MRGKGGGSREQSAADLLWEDLADLVKRVTAAAGGGDRVIVCGAGCGGPMSPGATRCRR